jgi:hypothetical protein
MDRDGVSDAGRAGPAGIDITRPNVARVYDYHIGGKDNFAADRAVGDQILQLVPEARESGRSIAPSCGGPRGTEPPWELRAHAVTLTGSPGQLRLASYSRISSGK